MLQGMVFITFVDEEGYNAALACNGAELDGQTLRVRHFLLQCIMR